MNYTTTLISTKKVEELIAALDPYADTWSEWIESGACFLNSKEITIISNYLLTGSHHISSTELNITTEAAASILKKAKRRLQWDSFKYKEWLTERLLEKHQIIKYETEQDRFLNSPLAFLSLPSTLKARLNYTCEETMNDILTKYSEKDMLRFRSFGKKNMEEFKKVLKANDCLHLLRQ